MSSKTKRVMTVLDIVIVCILLLFVAKLTPVSAHITSRMQQWWNPEVVPPLTVTGTRVAIPSVDWSASENTVVLNISRSCRYCDASKDFYKALSDKIRDNPKVRLLVVSTDDISDLRDLLMSESVEAHQAIHLEKRESLALGFFMTPTVLVVNGAGTARGVWYGQLSHTEEVAVLYGLSPTSKPLFSQGDVVAEVADKDLPQMDKEATILVNPSETRQKINDKSIGLRTFHSPNVASDTQLDQFKHVVIDCTSLSITKCRVAGLSLAHRGVQKVSLLTSSGS